MHMQLDRYHNKEQRNPDHNTHRGSVPSLSAQDAISPLYLCMVNKCLLLCSECRILCVRQCIIGHLASVVFCCAFSSQKPSIKKRNYIT